MVTHSDVPSVTMSVGAPLLPFRLKLLTAFCLPDMRLTETSALNSVG